MEGHADGGRQIRTDAGPVPEEHLKRAMEENSPDGMPPDQPVRRESKVLFWSVLVLVTGVVMVALIWRSGSVVPGLIALVLMLGFIVLAAWPTLNAGVDRRIEERHVADRMKSGRPL